MDDANSRIIQIERLRPTQATKPAAESATKMIAITDVPAPVGPGNGIAGIEVGVPVGV